MFLIFINKNVSEKIAGINIFLSSHSHYKKGCRGESSDMIP